MSVVRKQRCWTSRLPVTSRELLQCLVGASLTVVLDKRTLFIAVKNRELVTAKQLTASYFGSQVFLSVERYTK